MSRARFRFLRMLLPSGNWRVSVTLNRLIRALFRRGFFRVLFRRGFSVHSFAGAFHVASFAGALTVHSFVGAFSERCFAGAFSVRSFKLEFWLIASFEWIDMLDASFLNFFSINARCVLDQFWGSPRGNQHIREWINWNWNHQKKRPEAWHRIKSYQKRIIRFNQILLQFFLHNCSENQIPIKHMTNLSMIRIKRSLRYNVIY